jgi:NhaA family Na+:H+ antiporter
LLANDQLSHRYFELEQFPLSLGAGDFLIRFDVRALMNDGLMSLFFLMVGLEIKRELLVGELQDGRFAVTVLAAALGGMLAPALVYCVFNWHSPTLVGWGIPMATDTAFSLGVLFLLGNRVPQGLKVFLIAYAIMDDIGAIIVIAVFYSEAVNLAMLGGAAACVLLLLLLNVLGFRHISIYVTLGVV